MKLLLIAGGIGFATFFGVNTEMSLTNFTQSELSDNEPDSIQTYQIQHVVKTEILSRLQDKGGLTTEWGHMDKIGHRDLIFMNAITEFKQDGKDNIESVDNWNIGTNINDGNGWVRLSENNEVFGEIARMDGSHRSHICSFKIIYPDGEIKLRRSALDNWEDIVSFTGVKNAPKISDDPRLERLEKEKEKE